MTQDKNSQQPQTPEGDKQHDCVFCGEVCQPAPTKRGWTRIDFEKGLHFDCAQKVVDVGKSISKAEGDKVEGKDAVVKALNGLVKYFEWLIKDPNFKEYVDAKKALSDLPASSGEEKSQDDCSNHKKDLFGQTDMKVVAEAIGDLHYEMLFVLLRELSQKLKQDSRKDFSKNRIQLSGRLKAASTYIKNAYIAISEAWQISKPFMNQNSKKDHHENPVQQISQKV